MSWSFAQREAGEAAGPQIRCPQCGKLVPLTGTTRPPSAPFCSTRCRMLDIGAWSDEAYRISRPLDWNDVPVFGAARTSYDPLTYCAIYWAVEG